MMDKDDERSGKIATFQRLVDEGLARGVGSRSKEALFVEARVRVESEKLR